MPPALREWGAVFGLALLLTIVLTYPVAFRLGSGGRLDTGDGQLSIWNVAWVARALVLSPAQVYDTNIFHPHANTLAFSEANLGSGVLAIPGYWLTRNPLVAHNSVLLMAFVAAFVSMYALARHLTGSPWASLAPAVAFAFCPYIFARIPHIQLQWTAGLPLALLAFHRFVEHRTPGRAIVLGLVLGAVALTCAYYGIFAGLTVGLGVLFFAVAHGLWRRWEYWVGSVAAAALSVLIVIPFFLPYLELRERTGFGRSLEDAATFSADWRAYFASAAWAHRWMLSWLETWNEVLFPGFLLPILAAAGGWVALRWDRESRRRQLALFYALLALLALWASFGPGAGLYTVFFNTIPVFSFLRAPARFGILVVLGLCVLASLGISHAFRSGRIRRRALAGSGLGLLLAAEFFSGPIRWEAAPRLPAAYRMLAMLPRGPVAEFPFYWERSDFPRHALYMYLSTYHWHPLVNGYSDLIPQDFRDMALPVSSFPARAAFELLEERRTRYAMFHLNLYDVRSRERLIERLEEYGEYLRPLSRTEDVWLYEIVGFP